MDNLVRTLKPILYPLYRLHDTVSDFLVKHVFSVKKGILILAHLSLFGFFFPELRKDFGEAAANLLIFILFLSPLSKIFRMRVLLQLMTLRRELGIMMGYLATVHGVGYLIDPDWFEYIILPMLVGNFWGDDPRYVFGIFAYALTLPLLFTSNALSQRLLGPKWKLLHRTVYIMFAFAILHRFVVKDMTPMALFQMFVLVSAYASAKLLAWRNILPPLVEVIRLVAEDYRQSKAPAVVLAQVAPLESNDKLNLP